ncbi:MAG: HXXEE domain-containing protein [Saprospiraceae bacterium]|nr:HXXEE domain-containing protein [Saprospiraceae bacterium]MCB0675721.1 HXXEE domain-containing protein [Saprospiraceae bacterium]MCB0680539.1 HXXEE domain-containing protein [Saprospiraceae bacterium]
MKPSTPSHIWPWIGAFGGAGVLVWQLGLEPGPLLDPAKVGWLNLAALWFHQFEEYVWPGGFQKFFNEHIYRPQGPLSVRLSGRAILLVNVPIAWSAYLLGAFGGEQALPLLAGLLGISFLNGCLHLALALGLRRYNPGVLTGALLFIPLAAGALREWVRAGLFTTDMLPFALALAIGGTAAIPLSIYLARDP